MAIEGVDYSYDRPSPAGLYAAGKRFVVRYGALGKSSKWLTASEVAALKTSNIDIVANVEESANSFRGAAAGKAHATAGEQFFRGLGMRPDRPIYFSVDWDAQPSDWPDIDAALKAAGDVIGPGRVGVYGSYATIEHCCSAGTAAWFWQTYAWSGGAWSSAANIRQYRNNQSVAGGAVDLDQAMTSDYGQWGAPVSTSQNGWPVVGAESVDNGLYAGVKFPNGALAGDVAWMFRWLMTQLDERVEPVIAGECWGWYVKTITGGTGISNHASGTALDFNAAHHPQGVRNTFTPGQRDEIHAILAEAAGAFRWGGDYTGTPDDMHFEIVKSAAAVKAARTALEDDEAMAFIKDQTDFNKALLTALQAALLDQTTKDRYAAALLGYDPGYRKDANGVPQPTLGVWPAIDGGTYPDAGGNGTVGLGTAIGSLLSRQQWQGKPASAAEIAAAVIAALPAPAPSDGDPGTPAPAPTVDDLAAALTRVLETKFGTTSGQ